MQSLDDDALILVDGQDRELGTASRAACHVPGGRLHRALSVYLFDSDGGLLVQQRQVTKQLWGGFWSNSCCSHPRAGEDIADAAARRVQEELGVDARLTALYTYEYRADFGAAGTEHELVHVFIGLIDPLRVAPNPAEVAAWRMLAPETLDHEVDDGARFTPWFRLAWHELRASHRAEIARLVAGRQS